MSRFHRLAATAALAAIPLAAPSCIVIDEHFDQPFDIDPPTQLWEQMHDGEVDDLGRDWIARCQDSGGAPVLIDGVAFCGDRDY